jgi:hypothetical protein
MYIRLLSHEISFPRHNATSPTEIGILYAIILKTEQTLIHTLRTKCFFDT